MSRQLLALGLVVFTAATIVICSRIAARPRPALRVGDTVLSTRDLALRDQVIRVYDPKETRKLGRLQLRKAYQAVQVLRDHGYPLTEKVIEQEQERIQLTSHAPDKLRRIQALFRGDQPGYRRVFVLPALAEHALYYEFFLHDPTIQRASREKAEAFLRDAARLGFDAAAKARGLTARSLSFSAAARTLGSDDDPDLAGLDGDSRRRLGEFVHSAAPGTILSIPLDNGETWLTARYIGKGRGAGKKVELQCVTFPKEDFGRWSEREVARVPVEDLTSD